MSDKCVVVDGTIVRVSDKFDANEGSGDMVAIRSILSAARESFGDRAERLGKMDCRNHRCGYDEPHKHGFQCGPKCACALGVQASFSEEVTDV